jgi:hypothetical protein
MKKNKIIIWVALAVITIIALIAGCNNRDNITSSDEIQTAKTNYTFNVDAHNYILLEYFKQVDFIDAEKILEDNKSQFVVNNQIDYELAAEFVVDNIDLFVDLNLWEKVTEDAEVVFNLPAGSLNVPFSNGLIQYADLDGTHGGYNFFMQESTARLNEMIRFLDDNVKAHLSVAEYDNLLSLTALSHQATTEYSDMQDFYYDALADTTFSEEYQEILTFGLNDINFKKYLDNNQDDFNTCYTRIEATIADVGAHTITYYGNRYNCERISCNCGARVQPYITHVEHLAGSQGSAADASAEVGFWVDILNLLGDIGDLL